MLHADCPPTPPGRRPIPPAHGLRRADPAQRRALAVADRWAGLPDGVTRWRLAAALRAAARPLGLSAGMLRMLEHYLDLSYDQDWAADSEPVICRPLVEIAEALDLGERQARNLERALVDRGLLAFRDSGNHHRRGRRDRRTGRLVWAYGPTLAPLGVRALEIIALADSARADIAAMRRSRLALAALRRRIRAGLAAAEAAGVAAADIAEAFAAVPERAPAGLPPSALEARRAALSDIADWLDARLQDPCPPEFNIDGAAQPAISDRQQADTSKPNAINGKGIALEKAEARPASARTNDAAAETRSDHGLGLVPLALALAAAGPAVRAGLPGGAPPTWRDLAEAARAAAPALGIHQHAWGAACERLGRGGAALAAIVLEGGLDRAAGGSFPPVRAPSAYWRGLLERAEAGTLRLDRSIRGLSLKRSPGGGWTQDDRSAKKSN